MNKLREIFDPDSELPQILKDILAEAANRKSCLNCKNCIHVDPYLPGFVTDYPSCKISKKFPLELCDKYVADVDTINELKELAR